MIMKRNKFYSIVGKLYVFFTAAYLLSSYAPNPYIKTAESIEEYRRASVIYLPTVNRFSEEKLINYLIEINIKFPEIVLAQAKLESSNFTSDIFLENHNFFGMKCAKKRAYLHKGSNRGHAKYDRWEDCVIDYALYQATYLSGVKTKEEYFEYLSRYYAEDPTYVTQLKSIMKRSL